jgi:hypothetical protein
MMLSLDPIRVRPAPVAEYWILVPDAVEDSEVLPSRE